MTGTRDERSLRDKLAGKTRLAVDAAGKNALTGMIYRSPIERGRLRSLQWPDLPGGIVIVTSRDVPGPNSLRFGETKLPVLTGRDIRWRGQPLLLAAGEDERLLRDWMNEVRVDVAEQRVEEEETVSRREITKGRIEDMFRGAFQIVEEELTVPASAGLLSPSGAVCIREGNSYSLHVATSWPSLVRRGVSRTLRVSREHVKVRPYPTGEGPAHSPWYHALTACRAALLSRKSKRSIRLFPTPDEMARFGPGLPGGKFSLRGAVDPDGRIMALDVDFLLEVGYRAPLGEELLDRVILAIIGVYPVKNLRIRGRLSTSPHPPAAFGPAGGLELGFLVAELYASRVAEMSLQVPRNWRIAALPVKGQATGPGIELRKDNPLRELMERAIQISDFERKQASFEQLRVGRGALERTPWEFRGIGMAASWSGGGFLSSLKDLNSASLSVRLDKDGKLSVFTPAVPNNKGLLKIWSTLAAEILGLEESAISFPPGLPEGVAEPGPSMFGRNVGVYTKLIELACQDLSKRRFRDPLPIEVTRSRRTAGKGWDPETLEGTPFDGLAWGIGIVEVALDTRTLVPQIRHIWLCLDAGRILDDNLARSSVENAASRALAWCQGDPSPRERDPGYPPPDGIFPRPPCTIEFRNADGKSPPQGVSTLPWVLIPAAFLRAVGQASGKTLNSLPVVPETLFPLEGWR